MPPPPFSPSFYYSRGTYRPVDLPRSLILELTNACNFTECAGCPTSSRTPWPKGFMSGGTFHRVLEELKTWDHEYVLHMFRRGESLLHPNFDVYVHALG